ncbi:MAG: GGDEF domain-containing protein [Clostridiales bacterium]|nr:GGDEF domain-containing protein [Clostridiales bacterium]
MEGSVTKKPITFGEIALALAGDYDSIYVIDSNDDSYVEYIAEGDNKELVKRQSGDNFYKDVIHNCRELVYPDDQENFLNSFRKETVTEVLKNGRSFSINYRLVIDGTPYHYFLKTIRGSDDKVIIGVQNVDEQRKRELEAEREKMTYQYIAGALASRYEAIYYINIVTNAFTLYSSSDVYGQLGTIAEGEDFFTALVEDVKKIIYPDDIDFVLSELSKDRLTARLEEEGSVAITYRQQLDDRIQYVTLSIVYLENDKDHIVMGVMNVDAQKRHEQSIIEASQMFNEVAMALSSRYEVIYRVNTRTNEYYEFSSSSKYTKLEVGNRGEDFFGDTQRNMKSDIYEEDYPMMAKAMDKENLLHKLSGMNKIFLNYRLKLDGRPQYVSLVIMKPTDDSDHIIVALENIDEAKRRELEFEAAIGSAIDMANRDALTGVKNKHAYVNTEVAMDNQIAEGEETEFAIAVCDINGLKQVNDNQGHSTGDDYIKSACHLICTSFAHSPVFRIGGDEFVVILKGNDYQNRFDIIERFAEKQIENRRAGLVTLAYGISEFDKDKDLRVQDVFERADDLMYENKKRFKGEISDKDESASDDPAIRFYELYEQLMSVMTDVEQVDIGKIESILSEICVMFRLSKGVTRVYRNPQEEQAGTGETLCCFDTGKVGKEIIKFRVVTSVMSSATIAVYMAPDEKPLDDEERWKVELVMRTTLSFVSRNRLKNIVEELAYYDDNGYPNLRSWNKRLIDDLMSGHIRGKLAFHYNLRHFSLINQEFGREAGDSVMKIHFDNLRDIIGNEGYAARLGGDNFIGICPPDKAESVTTFFVEAPVRFGDGKCVNISSSVGFFKVPDDYSVKTPSDIMGKIINASRVAQSGMAGHMIYYDDTLMERKEKSMKIQQRFSDSLAAGELRPYYQPKVNIGTGELVGAEALCRWFHAEQMIPPMDFIPVLEETNEICRLDLHILECVCKDMRRWLDEGRNVVRVSVNFSRKNMLNIDLPDTVCEVLDRYSIPHELIEIELTETTSDVEFSDLKRIVNRLHDYGVYTSVDDFGMGYSSLNLIRDIPWNTLKIDRSFLPVGDEDKMSVRSIMFRHVVSMSRQLGLECIAEGVETEEQLQILRDSNCEMAQGFYYDKPLPVSGFEERLDRRYYGR